MTDNELFSCLTKNDCIREVLENAAELRLDDWYVSAGAICQTVWNIKHGNCPTSFIKDIDLVYFDIHHDTRETAQTIGRDVQELFGHLPIPVEITNQATVHVWYESEFGFAIEAYKSTEEAIATWPTTPSSIGVRLESDGSFKVCAPFGLSDLDSMVVRPNKKLVTKEIYYEKANRWKRHWPNLTIIEW